VIEYDTDGTALTALIFSRVSPRFSAQWAALSDDVLASDLAAIEESAGVLGSTLISDVIPMLVPRTDDREPRGALHNLSAERGDRLRRIHATT
jgi:hypothetical protein